MEDMRKSPQKLREKTVINRREEIKKIRGPL